MGKGRVLIEYDHTSNIFLHVKQAESTFPAAHTRTHNIIRAFSSLALDLFSPQLDSQTAGDFIHPPLPSPHTHTPSFILPKASTVYMDEAEDEYISRERGGEIK